MEIKVLRHSDNKIFSNDMSDENKNSILEIHFCTSYTHVCVQEETAEGNFYHSDIILPPLGTKPNLVDLIATQEDPTGEFVT